MAETREIWTVLKVLTWTKGYLAEKGVENARLEAEWLLCAALGIDRVGLYVNYDKPLADAELVACRTLVARRAKREPLQYILGSQDFCDREFAVMPGVLIPRHDTEVLVREAIKRAADGVQILDVGVGSGCIAVALAAALPGAQVYGVDRSLPALDLAARNAACHGINLVLRHGSLFEPFSDLRFDLIVSNPPYIPTADLAGLQPEVRDYEPREALDGGVDGLDYYRLIVPAAVSHLFDGGWLLVEVGCGQAADVRQLYEQTQRFGQLFTACDPAGIERVVGGMLQHGV
jgi:release factor glutamine methyltransferase